jgi:hypothetical protein
MSWAGLEEWEAQEYPPTSSFCRLQTFSLFCSFSTGSSMCASVCRPSHLEGQLFEAVHLDGLHVSFLLTAPSSSLYFLDLRKEESSVAKCGFLFFCLFVLGPGFELRTSHFPSRHPTA